MIVIGARGDLAKLNGTDPVVARFVAEELVPGIEESAADDDCDWDPDIHGIILVLECMADLHRAEQPACYGEHGSEHWEYVSYHEEAGAFLTETGTNQIVCAVVPDAPWLGRDVRAKLLEAAGFAGSPPEPVANHLDSSTPSATANNHQPGAIA